MVNTYLTVFSFALFPIFAVIEYTDCTHNYRIENLMETTFVVILGRAKRAFTFNSLSILLRRTYIKFLFTVFHVDLLGSGIT